MAEPTDAQNQATSQQADDQDLKPLEGVDLDEGQEDPGNDQLPVGEVPPGSTAEPPAATGKDPEQTTDVNQEAVDKKINRLTFKRHEERRKKEEAEQKYAEAQARIRELEGRTDEVVVPEMPDPYDPDFQQQMAVREEAIRKKERLDLERNQAVQSEQSAAREQAEAAKRETQELAVKMYEEGAKLGIDQKELNEADVRASMFIKDPSLVKFILGHEKAPLIVKYLGANATMLENLSKLDPATAAAVITTEIVPKTDALMPKTTNTPDPPPIPEGKGPGEQKSEYMDGVTLE